MNLQAVLTKAHTQHFGKPCRPIERWDKFTLTELQQVIANIPPSTVLSLMLRLLEDFNNNRRGLPDLVLWREGNHAFAEVKGPGDTLSDPQRCWLRALQAWGTQTILVHVADTEPS
jgi:fanconi-associated nuclease 1